MVTEKEDYNETNLLSLLPMLSQRQDSLFEQLNDLFQIANRLGMYDAADILKPFLSKEIDRIEAGDK